MDHTAGLGIPGIRTRAAFPREWEIETAEDIHLAKLKQEVI